MSIEVAIIVSGLIGLCIGIAIDAESRRERDQHIKELEEELNRLRHQTEV